MITYKEANEIEQQRFRIGTAPTVPTTLYVLLSTTAIAADGTGTTEPSTGSYARVAVASSSANWSTPSNGGIANLIKIEFPKATADWGTITYIGLTDASTSGSVRYYQSLTRPKTVQQDDVVNFEVGALTFTVTN